MIDRRPRRVLALAATAVALLAAGVALAADPRPITLAEAVTMAEKNAPSTIAARGQLRASNAGVSAAYASFLPSVSVSAGATRQLPAAAGRTRIDTNGQVITLPNEPWSSNIGLGANVELFDGGQRIFALKQAHAREDAAEVNIVSQRYAAALAAKQQFYNVLAARESEGAARAQLEQAEQQLRFAFARVKARTATRSDSLRAEIQMRNARLAVSEAASGIDVANASLTRAVGSDEPVTAAPADSVAPTSLALDEVELQRLAVDGPAVKQARASLDIAKAGTASAWTDYLPSLSASYSRSGSGTGNAPALVDDDFSYAGSFRLSLSLPIFNQLQRETQLTAARIDVANQEAELRDARLAAIEGLTQQLASYRSAGDRLAAQTATVEAAQEDLRVQQQRYAVGGSTLLDVLTSQTQLDQARRDLIRARYDLRVAKAQIEALVGRDL